MQLSLHPAIGLSNLLPGWYAVPQNPIRRATDGVSYTPTIGDILEGHPVVPQNPIVNFTTGQVPMIGQQPGGSGQLNGGKVALAGCGCGCGGDSCGCGLGDLSSDWATIQADLAAGNYSKIFSDTVFSIPLWVYLAGAALFLFAPSQGPSRVSRAKKAYRAYSS